MPLKYPGEWKFEGPGEEIPIAAVSEFHDVILKIAAGHPERWDILESFKAAFGRSAYSSSESWAESDLYSAMKEHAENAALFLDAIWAGIETVKQRTTVPPHTYINSILRKHSIPFLLDPPQLLLQRGDVTTERAEASDTVQQSSAMPVYRRLEEIGSGGFGRVYKVRRVTSVGEFDFAMKVLDPSPFSGNPEAAIARFRREISILARLQHRAIVPYLDAGVDQEGNPYVLMPLVEGTGIRDALEGRDLRVVLLAFEEILRALEYAHLNNVIHRDLKPSNIIVRHSDGQPVIVDFGCAYQLDDATTASLTTSLVGSLGYIPAEVIHDPKRRSPQQDVYACGVMLYEVLARVRPNPVEYDPLCRVNKEYEGVDSLVREAIAPANTRFKSASAFRQRILDALVS